MTSEFRRAHLNRTHVGDVLREPNTGRLFEVERVWQAGEYITERVDGRFYRYRHGEKTALVVVLGNSATRTWKREY